MSEQNIITGCWDDDCKMCSGEACNLCGAGCWSNRKDCTHDVIERHEESTVATPTPPPTAVAKAAAREIVPDCLSRTCFKTIGQDQCWGCDDSIKERERVAAIITKHLPAGEVEAALVDEVQRRMDAVLDAAVEWKQTEGDGFIECETLEKRVDELLELRDPPAGEPKPVVCRKCGHRESESLETGYCRAPLNWYDRLCGCKCEFGEPKPVDQKGDNDATV